MQYQDLDETKESLVEFKVRFYGSIVLWTVLIVSLTLLFTLPFKAFAAIGFDNAVTQGGGLGTSRTISKTNTGSNLFLFGCIDFDVGDTPTMTYNGVSMNVLDGPVNSGGGESLWTFYLTGAISGTANVVVSWTNNAHSVVTIASYTGVNQASPISTHTTNTSSASAVFVDSLTLLVSNTWLVDCVNDVSAGVAASGVTVDRAGTKTAIGDQNGVVTIGPQSNTWTGNLDTWGSSILELAPVGSPVTTKRPFFWSFWW